MTSPNTNQDDNKARALFATVLTIGAGFAGLAVAGIVLGLDYLLHGEPHQRDNLAQQRDQRRRDRYADAMAWLENDRLERERFRQRRREWFAADPDTRGEAPGGSETFARVLARCWNSLLVGATRFGRGWRQGRKDAQTRRDAGDTNWWKPAPTERPAEEPQPEPPATTVNEPTDRPEDGPQQPEPRAPIDDVIDAEIVSDTELPSTDREVVPVGENPQAGPDPSLDEYSRRLEDLDAEVRQNHRRPTEQAQLN